MNKLDMWIKSLLTTRKLSSQDLEEELWEFIENVERQGINDGILRKEDGTIVELLNWWDHHPTRPAVLHLLTYHKEEEVWRMLQRNLEVEMLIEFHHLPLYWDQYGLALLAKDPKFRQLVGCLK